MRSILLALSLAACVAHDPPPPDCDTVICKTIIECQGSKMFVDIEVCNGDPDDVLAEAKDRATYLASTCDGSVVDTYCGSAQ